MKTVLECLESGSRYLEERGIEDARRNMQWLVAHQLACSRVELYTQFDRPLGEEELVPLREALKRRGAGEPLQHLLGVVEFCGREFRCDSRALVPRPETEELVEEILKLPLVHPCRLLDMGTGSGVIGLTLALRLAERCQEALLVDLSAEALDLARENAERTEVSVTFLESDLFECVEGQFHLIAANLPYVADSAAADLQEEVKHDPRSALFAGTDGLETIRRFIPKVGAHLVPGGHLAMEVGFDQCPEVEELLRQAGLREVRAARDLSGNPRFVFAQAPVPA